MTPTLTIPMLAQRLYTAPHYLSRTFSDYTGMTVSRHRSRLGVRLALERLAEGETGLAGLASELGFADQAHLTRTVRRETGATPAALRPNLSSGACDSARLVTGRLVGGRRA